MSLRTQVLGLLVGLSAAVVACGAEPTSSTSPRINGSGGSGNSTSSTAGTGNAGAGNSSNVGGTGDPGAGGTTVTTTTGGTDPGASGSVGVAGTTGTGTAGTTSTIDQCMPVDSLKALPLAVDGPFIPGGYFVDQTLPDNVMGITHAACDAGNPAVTYGACHKWSFLPSKLGLDPTTNMMVTYGGVFWLAGSATNWGTGPGINVAPGAQTVKFKAWGATGTEVVTFSVGGVVGTMGADCLDNVSFGAMGALKQALTTTPTDYVINLAGQTYPNGVIGGFTWSTENTSTTTPVTFMVQDIRWTSDPS